MPTRQYAQGTEVPIAKSREEIERDLRRYNASGFMYGSQGDDSHGGEVAAVAFEMQGRRYRIEIRYPNAERFRSAQRRGEAAIHKAREQEIKRLWRALTLIIKAKLEAVKSGVRTIEEEFFFDTVMTNNQTVGQWLEPQIKEMYRSGEMPPLIPGLSGTTQKQLDRTKQSDAIEGEFKES